MTEYLKGKGSCIFVDSEEVCRPFGSSKFFNIIMLGIAAGTGRLGIEKETVLEVIKKRVPERFIETNNRAFLAGFEIGNDQK